MPQPPISIHDSLPSLPFISTSTSPDGSVNGKKLGLKTPFGIRSDESVNELVDGRFQVNHAHAFVNHERFNLMEHEHVRRVYRVRPKKPDPERTMRIGGLRVSITRICMVEVCVRNSVVSSM